MNDNQDQSPERQLESRQLERIQNYLEKGLATEDPLQACLVAQNSELMRTATYYNRAIKLALADGPMTMERIEPVQPMIDRQERLCRQIQRYAHLGLRIAAAGEKNSAS